MNTSNRTQLTVKLEQKYNVTPKTFKMNPAPQRIYRTTLKTSACRFPTTCVLVLLVALSSRARAQQLLQSSASGTVTIGGNQIQIVGGRVMNNAPIMVMHATDLKLATAEIDASQWAFTESLLPENNSVGHVTSSSPAGVDFGEALFLSPPPQRNSDGTGSLPFPFALALSPSAGGIWKGVVPSASFKDGTWTVSAVIPDIYTRTETNQNGKTLLHAQNLFAATKTNELAIANAIRFEQVSFSSTLTFQISGTPFSVQKTVFPFFGKDATNTFPIRVIPDASLANKLGWCIENGPSKHYITEFTFARDGRCSAVYANGLVVPIAAAAALRKDVETSSASAGEHFAEALKSGQK